MKASALTDKGRVRVQNQDTVFMSTSPLGGLPNLFMVADGMGGHQAGDYCSRMLVERITSFVGEYPEGAPVRILREAIEEANRSLFLESVKEPHLAGMGSTLTAAVVDGDILCVFNIGDSRLYVLEDGSSIPKQVTRDHSYVEEMVQAGRMKRGSSMYQMHKNIITRAVGIGPRVDIDAFEVELPGVNTVLICSDGLTNMVGDEEIGRILLAHPEPEGAAKALIEEANANGGRDNISVVIVLPEGEGAAV